MHFFSAHNSRSTMLRTIQTLKQLESKNIQAALNVKDVLENLLHLEGGHQVRMALTIAIKSA